MMGVPSDEHSLFIPVTGNNKGTKNRTKTDSGG